MDDLLDIARLTGGKIVLNRRPVDLGAIVERCIATLNDSSRLSRHVCRKAIESVWIDGDEARIEQIIMNVVGNALKFTPIGGEINIEVSSEGPSAVLRVTDTGIGITPDVLPRIFELFVQGDRSIDRTSGGLGVGLALVRRLTELHGGAVTAASAGLGRGATFTILLPRVSPVPTAIQKETIREAISRPRRILVVEDNRDGREMLRTMLELQGHEVHEAADGVSAVELVEAMRPDVAVVDIGLPGVDGYTVAERIRAAESGDRRMRLIALTGYGSETDRRRAADAGFDAHLTKPVDPQRLAQLLASDDCPPDARC
jgi:CheY-like chemotaxis protein/anti-sigma regulatory factor (Ser/Thr protein kinase)